MRVVLACGDPAAVNCARELQNVLVARGHVAVMLEQGATTHLIYRRIQETNVVWTGFATDADKGGKIERDAIDAAHHFNVPVARYADTFGVWNRGHEDNTMRQIALLFVLNADEVVRVGLSGLYPKTHVLASGNPMHEQYFFPVRSRDEVRATFNVAHRILVLSPGTKFPHQNRPLWIGIGDALAKIPRSRFHLLLSKHPGDVKGEAYQDVLLRVGARRNTSISLVTRDEMPGPQLVIGADLVICFMSELGIGAAICRVPTIEFRPHVLQERAAVLTGDRPWEPIEEGWAELVASDDPSDLAAVIKKYITRSSARRTMLAHQERAFSAKPPIEGALRTMVLNMELIAKQ